MIASSLAQDQCESAEVDKMATDLVQGMLGVHSVYCEQTQHLVSSTEKDKVVREHTVNDGDHTENLKQQDGLTLKQRRSYGQLVLSSACDELQ